MVSESKDRYINTDAKIENDQVKRQPHERDEAPDAQDQRPRGVIRQAAEDIEQGLVDTDMRNTPGVGQPVKPKDGPRGEATPLPEGWKAMRARDAVVPGRETKR